MKKENIKSPKKGNPAEEEDRWINVHDDDVMREYGLLRSYKQSPRDPSVWIKNSSEKNLLRKARHSSREDMHFHTIPRKIIRVRAKLIINLYKNKRFSKTTYSTECWQHEIPEILAKYRVTDRNGFSTSVVRKYVWNGRTYSPNNLPFAW